MGCLVAGYGTSPERNEGVEDWGTQMNEGGKHSPGQATWQDVEYEK